VRLDRDDAPGFNAEVDVGAAIGQSAAAKNEIEHQACSCGKGCMSAAE
jgi:hypothetical protein